ncbi:MAG: MBL fold metallo-hydrolase [Planctomycetaceae bacterium]|nr:MBL fold metallo-hydrolase [Planctomycetaceae bacterium]
MFFRQIYDEKLAEAAYLIGCQKTGEAIVIDPERDIDRYEAIARANGLRIVAVADTHIHADYLTGAREFAEKGARLYLSDEGDTDWKYQWLDGKSGGGRYDAVLLKDGDTFLVGNIRLRAIHTPGHTPEHLAYEVTDVGGGADAPMGIATGDFLFVGDLGRPDLLESAAGIEGVADPSAHRLYQTVLRTRDWADYLQIWPGHGAGSACGKALGAIPQSTVGYERRFNAALRAATSERAFVDFILDGQPEPPFYFARMKRDNKLGPRVLGGLPKPPERTPAEFARLDGHASAIVDTRPWAAFRESHMDGALFLPLGNSFTTDAGSMIAENERIYLVVEPSRVEEVVRDLIRIGLDNIAGWIDATKLHEVAAAGAKFARIDEVDVAGAQAMIAGDAPFVLDVRRRVEFAQGNIAGASNIAHTRLLGKLAEIPRDRPILVHCQLGGRSARAAALLAKHGHRVTNLAGGFAAWRSHGAETAAKKGASCTQVCST